MKRTYVDPKQAWSNGLIESREDGVDQYNTYPVVSGLAFHQGKTIAYFMTSQTCYSVIKAENVVLRLPNSFRFSAGAGEKEGFLE